MQEALHKLLALPKAVSKEVSVCCCRPRVSVLLEILSYIYKFIFQVFRAMHLREVEPGEWLFKSGDRVTTL